MEHCNISLFREHSVRSLKLPAPLLGIVAEIG